MMHCFCFQIGKDWGSVVDKCCKGHFQPLLLLYANPMASVIPTETAMQKTYHIQAWPNPQQAQNGQLPASQGDNFSSPVGSLCHTHGVVRRLSYGVRHQWPP